MLVSPLDKLQTSQWERSNYIENNSYIHVIHGNTNLPLAPEGNVDIIGDGKQFTSDSALIKCVHDNLNIMNEHYGTGECSYTLHDC